MINEGIPFFYNKYEDYIYENTLIYHNNKIIGAADGLDIVICNSLKWTPYLSPIETFILRGKNCYYSSAKNVVIRKKLHIEDFESIQFTIKIIFDCSNYPKRLGLKECIQAQTRFKPTGIKHIDKYTILDNSYILSETAVLTEYLTPDEEMIRDIIE